MNTALHRRLQKLEERHHDQIVIKIDRGEVPFPDVVVRFVTAKPDPEEPDASAI